MPLLYCNRNGKSHINRATMENLCLQAFAFQRLEKANSQTKTKQNSINPANITQNISLPK